MSEIEMDKNTMSACYTRSLMSGPHLVCQNRPLSECTTIRPGAMEISQDYQFPIAGHTCEFYMDAAEAVMAALPWTPTGLKVPGDRLKSSYEGTFY